MLFALQEAYEFLKLRRKKSAVATRIPGEATENFYSLYFNKQHKIIKKKKLLIHAAARQGKNFEFFPFVATKFFR